MGFERVKRKIMLLMAWRCKNGIAKIHDGVQQPFKLVAS